MRRPLIDDEICVPRVRITIVPDEGVTELPTEEALSIARKLGLHLALSPGGEHGSVRDAVLLPVCLPLRWERGPAPLMYPCSERPVDPRLWCTLDFCHGRHFLLASNHTFPGRVRVACPVDQRTHVISRRAIVTLSEESRYWMLGFLAASAPAPTDGGGDDDTSLDHREEDEAAWRSAEALFLETGSWIAFDRACHACGALRLPSSPDAERCVGCLAGPEGTRGSC